ncbi:hypothetical protein RAA17_03265 [Komagataeibacter rhaeticus]|nr:hypothetical protein [Komagataeibacter rhaeticus]
MDAETCRLTWRMRRAGRHVLLHRLDLSKTGLLAPGLAALEHACAPQAGEACSPTWWWMPVRPGWTRCACGPIWTWGGWSW